VNIAQIAEDVRAIKLQPGEDLILEFDDMLTVEQVAQLRADVEAAFLEPRRLVVVTGGLRVVKEESPAADAVRLTNGEQLLLVDALTNYYPSVPKPVGVQRLLEKLS
jgi:hypothetical protein